MHDDQMLDNVILRGARSHTVVWHLFWSFGLAGLLWLAVLVLALAFSL